jgi:cytochrome b
LTPPPPPARVKVWDPIVRLFHWTVALGCIANLTVLREVKSVHRYVGYVILAAVVIRLVWGFVGTRHARYSDFAPSPRHLLGYLKALVRGQEPRYIGHNPAGALMIFALIALVTACGISGWMMGLDAYWGVKWVETLHEVAANAILTMATIHVLAALIESWRHRENLILAMVTGFKRAPQGNDVSHAPPVD